VKRFLIIMSFGLVFVSGTCKAGGFQENPEKSLFFGFDLGAGLNPDKDVRSPLDYAGLTPEAYSLGGFLFGIYGGFRFSEIIGIEAAWHEQRHDAHSEWGGVAYYQLAHVALRLAWPLPTRQTLVFRAAPAMGTFTYGDALPGFFEDNSTLVVGGLMGLTLEHEFSLGVVGLFEISYLPLLRRGMGGVLKLEYYEDYWDESPELVDTKDFSKNEFVQLVWISAGFQFEWTFR
jgi:hypothetical protein